MTPLTKEDFFNHLKKTCKQIPSSYANNHLFFTEEQCRKQEEICYGESFVVSGNPYAEPLWLMWSDASDICSKGQSVILYDEVLELFYLRLYEHYMLEKYKKE